ncbi:MAG: bifunctional YncE family protein/alkaline phosphatase family protein, partial [Acidobacteria bacterium]|nr:bifunctional YncE family protein/alkaline phosphatase family protein [Acidobacteriota bacterium]
LGDPNVRESNSLCVLDVSDPAQPRVEAFVRTGRPFGQGSLGPFQPVGPNRPPDAAGQSLDALPRSTWAEQAGTSLGGSSPSGVLAAAGMVFVSNAHNDSITVIDASANQTRGEIPLRIPGLEQFRGVLPLGLAYHAATGWLLVAEAGINAIGIIDTKSLALLGHLPVGWFPTRVVVDRDNVFVTNAKGHGTGHNAGRFGSGETFQGVFRRGSISIFALPGPEELPRLTARVLEFNGFVARGGKALELPAGIRHVVLIVKENRTFDEVFGDVGRASNGRVAGSPALARFGRNADVASPRGTLRSRLALRGINVTPNHHAMAERWAFSDNFYADSEVSVDGHHWLVGSYPNAWTESSLMASYGGQKDFHLPTSAPGRLLFAQSNSSVHPEEQLEAGTLWHHLERHGLSFRNWGEGFELAGVDEGPGLKPTGARFLTNVPMPDPLYRNTSRSYPQYNMNIPDQYRATQFIAEVEEKYLRGGEPFPRLLYLHLPNDHLAKPRPEDGYPFEASYMADNDVALGRIVEFLSKTPWWRQMAIFITEDDAQGWVDHIDSHRTVFLLVSPYARKNYVSHVNASFPGMLKTVFRLLGLPPLNLFDAAASDLADCFSGEPDFTPYRALPVDPRLFDPAKAREPLDPQPSPRLDDPAVLREQHRR